MARAFQRLAQAEVRDLNLRFSERVDVVDISPAALSEEGHLVFVEGSPSPRTRSESAGAHVLWHVC